MILIGWLKIGIIGLPLAGVFIDKLVLRRKYPQAQRPMAIIIFGLTALSALGLFWGSRHHVCILKVGLQNCLFAALGTLSLFLLGLILVKIALADPLPSHDKVGRDYRLMLLTISAWAGMGLADNLFVLMMAWYLFLYIVNQWLMARGLKWRIFVLRDDYKDD